QVAETVVEKNLRFGKELGMNQGALAASIGGSLNALSSRLRPSMDVNALVQAVLRECYLLQNEDILDHRNKVKFYNEQKKWLREQQKKVRDLLSGMGPGDRTTVDNLFTLDA